MPNHLSSKTMAGLGALLGIAVAMSLAGKLTPELADVLKWVGGSFLAMRAVVNHAELSNQKKKDS
jgi:hypothetical protein